MTEARIPFGVGQRSGLERLAGGAPAAFNMVVDAAGAVRRRPCIEAYDEAPAGAVDADGVAGLYATSGGALYAVGGATTSGRSVYRVVNGVAASVSQASKAASFVRGYERPVFAETDALLVVAHGLLPPRKLVLKTEEVSALAGAPVCSHVIAHGSRLSANHTLDEYPGRISYSGTAFASDVFTGHEQWGQGVGNAGFYTAEARPDPVVALHEASSEVFAFGTRTTQVFVQDAGRVYSPLPTFEHGCIAPYSVTRRDQVFAWLDDKRRFIASDGREHSVLSEAIQQDLDNMAVVADCFGYRVHHGPVDAFVWTFPTDGRTFVLQKGGGWSQWASWDDASNNWAPLGILCHHQRADTGENLVGTTDGKVGKLTTSAQTDLGTRVPCHAVSGFLDRGTPRTKDCNRLRLVLQRGQQSTDSQLLVRWRDDLGEWNPPRVFDLGLLGDSRPDVALSSLGTYRRREWRFDFSGTEDLVLVEAIEDFEVLED